MDCRDVQNLLAPYSDGELDLVRRLQIEHHLAECSECAERERSLRGLRAALASPDLYHCAPSGLHEKLRAALAEPARRSRWGPSGALAATAAGIAVLAAGLLVGALWPLAGASAEDRLAENVVAGHARSLQVAHLMDLKSSDRHQLKPWLVGELRFAPHVPDLAPQGFPLSGGRLDYLTDRPVAALVYHRRQHVINLFTWPATDGEERPVRPLQKQGFHLRHWRQSGMIYWAISDLNGEELDAFVRLVQETATPVP